MTEDNSRIGYPKVMTNSKGAPLIHIFLAAISVHAPFPPEYGRPPHSDPSRNPFSPVIPDCKVSWTAIGSRSHELSALILVHLLIP